MNLKKSLKQTVPPENRPGHQSLRKGRISLPRHVYLVTSVTIGRTPFFHDFRAGCAAARCFEEHAVLDEAHMLAWVLMPDHAHWLIQLGEKRSLSTIVGRIKAASARMANRVLKRQGPLWDRAFYDHALRADEDLRQAARYVIANPIRAGLVKRAGDYPFWNAVWM